MKKMIAAFVAIAGVATAAQAAWGLKFEVSSDGGTTWSQSVEVDTSTGAKAVKLRVAAYHTGTDALAINGGLTTLMVNRFTGSNKISNWDASDSFANYAKVGAVVAGPTALAAGASGGNLILGTASGTAAQLASSFFSQTTFNGQRFLQTQLDLFTVDLTIGGGNQNRVLDILNNTFGAGSIAGITFYNSNTSATSGQPTSGRADINASIRVVPTPGSLALLGLGGLVVARRRR